MSIIDDLLSVDGRDVSRAGRVVWLIPVALATAATFVTAHDLVVVVPLLAVGLVPWALLAVGRVLPLGFFAAMTILPVAAILITDGLNASVFLGTTGLSYLASRVVGSGPLVAIVLAGLGLPFLSRFGGNEFDPGSYYFAIGDVFGIAVGVLLGHSLRLGGRIREAEARLAAARAQHERTRLARDVHDLVAHSLTVVVLHIAGSRRIIRTDPGGAEAALERAEAVCRDSLDGIRETVGLLRADDDPPSSGDLTHLLDTYRAAGIRIDARIDERSTGLPIFVQGLLYRVAQESLANAARYAVRGAPVTLTVEIVDQDVVLRITNAVGQQGGAGGGYGLRGLHEQVTGSGGTFSSHRSQQQWSTTCLIPLPVPST